MFQWEKQSEINWGSKSQFQFTLYMVSSLFARTFSLDNSDRLLPYIRPVNEGIASGLDEPPRAKSLSTPRYLCIFRVTRFSLRQCDLFYHLMPIAYATCWDFSFSMFKLSYFKTFYTSHFLQRSPRRFELTC